MRLHLRLALPMFALAVVTTAVAGVGVVSLLRGSFGFALNVQGEKLGGIAVNVLEGRSRGLADFAAAGGRDDAQFRDRVRRQRAAARLDLALIVDRGRGDLQFGPAPESADLAALSATSGFPVFLRARGALYLCGVAAGFKLGSLHVVGQRLDATFAQALRDLMRTDCALSADGLSPIASYAGTVPPETRAIAVAIAGRGAPVRLTVHVPAAAAEAARRRAIAATAVGGVLLLVAAVGFYGWAVFRITRPIRELAVAAERITAGDLAARMPGDAPAELGTLVRGFNEMAAALRAAQERLVHSAKLSSVGQMVAGISHELNNPLWGLLANAEFLSTMIKEGQPGREELDTITREAQRMKRTLTDLRGFVRPGDGVRERLDLNAVADEVAGLVRHDAEKAGVRCESALQPGGVAVDAAPDGVRQVALNLAINALQAMPKGGTLRIETGTRNGGSQNVGFLSVTDDGPGIPAESLPRLAEPFFTTKPGHLGLGLAIGHDIAQRHGGRLVLANRDGRGAVATLELPAAKAAA